MSARDKAALVALVFLAAVSLPALVHAALAGSGASA